MKTVARKSKSAPGTVTIEIATAAAKAADRRLAVAEKKSKTAKARLKAAKRVCKLARKAARKAAKTAKKAHKILRSLVRQANQPKPKAKPAKRPARKAARRPRVPKTVDELLMAAPAPASESTPDVQVA